MTDIVERLLADNSYDVREAAADEIERLRKALKPFKKFADEYVSEGFHDTEPMEEAGGAFVWKDFRKVREALEGK